MTVVIDKLNAAVNVNELSENNDRKKWGETGNAYAVDKYVLLKKKKWARQSTPITLTLIYITYKFQELSATSRFSHDVFPYHQAKGHIHIDLKKPEVFAQIPTMTLSMEGVFLSSATVTV